MPLFSTVIAISFEDSMSNLGVLGVILVLLVRFSDVVDCFLFHDFAFNFDN